MMVNVSSRQHHELNIEKRLFICRAAMVDDVSGEKPPLREHRSRVDISHAAFLSDWRAWRRQNNQNPENIQAKARLNIS